MQCRRPLKLSASAVRSYQECPYHYARDYVDRLHVDERAPVPSLMVGSSVHNVLANFVSQGGAAAMPADDLPPMLMNAWNSHVFKDPDHEFTQFQRAQDMLLRFHADPYPGPAVEDLATEKYLAWPSPRRGILATGRIDRLCLHSDRTLEVIDYKTGSRPLSTTELTQDFQAAFYRSLVAEPYRHLQPVGVRITFYYLPSAQAVSMEFEEEDFRERWAAIERIADAIRDATRLYRSGRPLWAAFPVREGRNCQTCSMREHCRQLAPEAALEDSTTEQAS